MDRCRVILTSSAGLTAVTAEGDLIPLDPLSDLDLATAVAVDGDTIWVAGTTRDQHPALLMFTAGRRTTVSLPARIDAIEAIAAATQGINVSATVDDHGELLRVNPAGVELIGELPAPTTRLATSGGLFVLGTMRNGEGSLLSGSAPPWRSRAIGRDVDIRAVAAGDGLLVVAGTEPTGHDQHPLPQHRRADLDRSHSGATIGKLARTQRLPGNALAHRRHRRPAATIAPGSAASPPSEIAPG